MPIEGQARVIPACLVIHNFICIYDPTDDIILEGSELEDCTSDEENQNVGDLGGAAARAETRRADQRRDEIADKMWEDYCRQRSTRRR